MVIAIIAVLAAMLLPALRNAKEASRASVCVNNLRQHYFAFMSYTDDYNGYLVGWLVQTGPSGCSQYVIWSNILPQLGYLPHWGPYTYAISQTLKCPSNPNSYGGNPYTGSYKDGTPNYMYVNDAGNDLNCPGNLALRKLSDVVHPDSKAMLYEGGQGHGLPTYACWFSLPPFYSGYFSPNSPDYCIADFHNNHSNVLFFDGHVQRFAPGAIDPNSDSLTTP